MSRIDDLIEQYAPAGVEYRRLGDVLGNRDRERKPVTRSARKAGTYPYYGANGVQDYVDDYIFDGTFLLLGEDGSVVRDDGTPYLNWATGRIWVNNHAHVLFSPSPDLELRFAFFYLQNLDISPWVTGGAQPKLNQQSMNKIPIPVPPVEVQREIIKVLDAFAQLEAGLEAELEAEMEARRKQYSHDRKALLSFAESEKVQWVTLREIGTWTGGVTPSKSVTKYWQDGTIPWVASMDISATCGREIRGRVTPAALDETSLRVVAAPFVAVVMRSNVLRRFLPVGYIEVDSALNQDVRALRPHEDLDARYVYQVLRIESEAIRAACVRTDGSMAAVDSKALLAWKIPVPPLEEQRRIVAILRKLDALVDELLSGLQAEIAARRQQYAYYRDRLLTFKEKTT